MAKDKHQHKSTSKDFEKLQQHAHELTEDLKRTRADFENFARRAEQDKAAAKEAGKSAAVLKLLPVIDNIERAVSHMPKELQGNQWAEGVASLSKNLDKSLENLGVKRIDAAPGTPFNPDLHEAIMMDDGEGDNEVIAEELQTGYTMDGTVIRHSLVKVTKQ